MPQVVKTELPKAMSKHLKFCKMRVIYQTCHELKNYFCFKGFIPALTLFSSKVLILHCSCSCNALQRFRSSTTFSISNNFRHFKVRVLEHQGVSKKKHVNQLKVPHSSLLGITCLFVTIK